MKIAWVLVVLFAAGCLSDSREADPSATASSPARRAAGEAYNETVPLRLDGAATAPPMAIPDGWGSLALRVWASTTAACGVVQRDPGATAEAQVRFTSPSGGVTSFTIPAGTHCVQPGQRFGGGANTAAPEKGNWTVQITGRGEGVEVHLVVSGS